MRIPACSILMSIVCGLLLPCLNVQAGPASATTFNQAYSGAGSSPFQSLAGGGLVLENFESGLLSAPGVSADFGSVITPGGVEIGGHAFNSGTSKKVTFTFSPSGDQFVTMAGLVLTKAEERAKITLRAWDAYGKMLGKVSVRARDLLAGGTFENRFLGLASERGISRIQIGSSIAGFEIDHLQFAYGGNFAVVPLPPALGLGAVGLLGVMILRRRRATPHPE